MTEGITVVRERTSGGSAPSSGATASGRFVPEVHRDLTRRLAWVAFIYSAAYLVVEATMIATMAAHGMPLDWWGHYLRAGLAIAVGLTVSVAARRGRIPAGRFADFAVAFEILAALGIVYGDWGWQDHMAHVMGETVAALGIPLEAAREQFVDRLAAADIRLLYVNGVPWVGIWVLIFPMVLPLSPRRTAVGALVSAAIVPLFYISTSLFRETPEIIEPWVWGLIADMTPPVFICAGIAIFGSRVMYRLTRDLARARRLGSYHLVSKIGEGGMGEVWRAEHRMLARPAAIKLIRSESLNREGVAGAGAAAGAEAAMRRFEREAQVIARLESPHTIHLYDFGMTDEGRFYYAMELLEGLTLKTLVQRHGAIPAARAAWLLRQVCHSLEEAHAHGLVHRDVKPGNIFVCRRGQDHDVVKVLDFGLVKEARRASASAAGAQLTVEGTTTGTPGFMAPEAALGEDAIDGRADLYALGCVGFWLVTGRMVFEGDTGTAILLRHLNEPPPRPSSCTELEIPEAFEALLLQCLEKDPARRPASAREVASQLAAAVPDGWSEEHARRWWEINAPLEAAARDAL